MNKRQEKMFQENITTQVAYVKAALKQLENSGEVYFSTASDKAHAEDLKIKMKVFISAPSLKTFTPLMEASL